MKLSSLYRTAQSLKRLHLAENGNVPRHPEAKTWIQKKENGGQMRMDGSECTERVTLDEDGIYRWSYDLDMYHNPNLRNAIMKVVFVVCMICLACWSFLFSVDGELDSIEIMVILGIIVGLHLLTLISYYIAALVLKGKIHLCFFMNESAILLGRKASTQKFMNIMAGIVGNTAGQSLKGRLASQNLNAVAQSGLTLFSDVFSIKSCPKYDAINLRAFSGGNQIWVGKEDYEFVREFIISHVPKKAWVH